MTEYASPIDWITNKLGPHMDEWNLSYQWTNGFYPTDQITVHSQFVRLCPTGHLLTPDPEKQILLNNKELCLECRFKPNDIVLLLSPISGYVGAIQWSDGRLSTVSVRLLDMYDVGSFLTYTNKNWFHVIPTDKTEESLAYEPVGYFDALFNQMDVPLFSKKIRTKGTKKVSKRKKKEDKETIKLIKQLSPKQLASLAEFLKR